MRHLHPLSREGRAPLAAANAGETNGFAGLFEQILGILLDITTLLQRLGGKNRG